MADSSHSGVLESEQSKKEQNLDQNDSSLNKEEQNMFSPSEISIVMSQAGCTRKMAIVALKESQGDVVNAICKLTS